jgi:hypothetical protein
MFFLVAGALLSSGESGFKASCIWQGASPDLLCNLERLLVGIITAMPFF